MLNNNIVNTLTLYCRRLNMKIFHKITLALLAPLMLNTQLKATSMTIQVDNADVAHASGAISTGTLHKTGTGTLSLEAANTLTTLDIQAGKVNVSATNNFGGGAVSFTTAPGSILAATAPVTVPVLTMTVAGELLADGSGALALNAVPTGASVLNLASTTATSAGDAITVGDLHTSVTPVTITGFVKAGAVGSLLTSGATIVSSGGTLELMGATAKSVPGATTVVQSGGAIQVAAGIAVPANDDQTSGAGGNTPATVADIFSNAVANTSANTATLNFASGSKLILGNGSYWARSVTVGTPS